MLAGGAKKNALSGYSALYETEPNLVFSKLSRTTFTDKHFRQLDSLETQLLWLYLVSSPKNTSLPGLMLISCEEMLADLGWEERLGDRARAQLATSLQELQDKDWIRYHSEVGMLLSTRIFDMNVPANPSIVAHWKRILLDMPRNVLVDLWARMARRKFRDLDRSASDRLGGKAWRLDTLEEFLADIDDCYSPPSEFEDDLLTEEDRKYIRVPANPTKPRVYPPLSLRRRKARELEDTTTAVAMDNPATTVVTVEGAALPLTEDVAKDLLEMMDQSEATDRPDPLALFSAAFERGADVVSEQRKPRVKPDIKERVSRECRNLVSFFLNCLRLEKPDAKLPTGDTLNAWYDDMDRMLRIDKREVDQIGNLIQWVTQDEFEKANVRCPRKLRQRFDQLEIKMKTWEAKQEREGGGHSSAYNQAPVYDIPILVPPPEVIISPEEREQIRIEQYTLAAKMMGKEKYERLVIGTGPDSASKKFSYDELMNHDQ